MTIIAKAQVPGTVTIDRAITEPIRRHIIDVEAQAEAILAARPAEVHPAWCMSADLYTTHGFNIPCGDHLGESANIPATDSDFTVCDRGALFPRFEVGPATKDGHPAVDITLFNPIGDDDNDWVAMHLRPADARTFAADLAPVGKGAVAADLDDVELTATASGLYGSVRAVTDGGSVRVTVVDDEKQKTIEAFLKPSEVDHMVLALVQAANVVESH